MKAFRPKKGSPMIQLRLEHASNPTPTQVQAWEALWRLLLQARTDTTPKTPPRRPPAGRRCGHEPY